MSARNRPAATPGLRVQAEAAAASTYKHRTAELEALAPLLLQLDQFMPGLRALGLDLAPRELRLVHEYVGNCKRRVLRADTCGVFHDSKRICSWLEALRALDFTEVSRSHCPHLPTALMRRGTLLLRVDVLRTPPAAATAPAHSTGPGVRQAIAEAQATAAQVAA